MLLALYSLQCLTQNCLQANCGNWKFASSSLLSPLTTTLLLLLLTLSMLTQHGNQRSMEGECKRGFWGPVLTKVIQAVLSAADNHSLLELSINEGFKPPAGSEGPVKMFKIGIDARYVWQSLS